MALFFLGRNFGPLGSTCAAPAACADFDGWSKYEMAHSTYCEACGKKGRTLDGLCHDCYDDVVSERWDLLEPDIQEEYEFSE